MVATARSIKQKHPDAPRGVCRSLCVRSWRPRDGQFGVMWTLSSHLKELVGMFEAKGSIWRRWNLQGGNFALNDATAAGRGYAVAGGVAESNPSVPGRVLSGCTGSYRTRGGLADCERLL